MLVQSQLDIAVFPFMHCTGSEQKLLDRSWVLAFWELPKVRGIVGILTKHLAEQHHIGVIQFIQLGPGKGIT